MIIDVIEYFDYEGYSLYSFDTEIDKNDMSRLANKIANGEAYVIRVLDNSSDMIGEELYAMIQANKERAERVKKNRSASAKKGWETRKANKKKSTCPPTGHGLRSDWQEGDMTDK